MLYPVHAVLLIHSWYEASKEICLNETYTCGNPTWCVWGWVMVWSWSARIWNDGSSDMKCTASKYSKAFYVEDSNKPRPYFSGRGGGMETVHKAMRLVLDGDNTWHHERFDVSELSDSCCKLYPVLVLYWFYIRGWKDMSSGLCRTKIFHVHYASCETWKARFQLSTSSSVT